MPFLPRARGRSAVVGLAALVVFLAAPGARAGDFVFTALDIGQGDSTVVVAPGGCAALLDGGPKGSGTVIKKYLREHGVTRLAFAVTSHFHADHIGGLDEVEQGTDGIPVGVVYDNGSPGGINTVTYTEYANQYAGRRVVPVLGQVIRLCEQVTFEFVAVDGNGLATSDENTRSVAVKISYGELDAVVGGDLMESPTNLEANIAPRVGPIEIYKVHHHGSKYSSGDAFLDVTQPIVATISVGKNSYGHPTPEALGRLAAHQVDVFQTEDPSTLTKLGDIQIASALGRTFSLTQGPLTRSYVSKGVDITPPTAPSALVAVPASPTEVDLSWQASSDAVGVTAYDITRATGGGSAISIGSTSGTAASDLGLTANTEYTYAVTARDDAGNVSAPASVAVRTPPPPDTTPPSTPTGLVATPGSGQVALAWQPSSDNVGVTAYDITRATGGGSAISIGSTSGTAASDLGLTANTEYTYAVTARDDAGNVSAPASVTVRTPPPPDTTPPSKPTGLVATPGSGQVALAWQPSSDDVGVAHYVVQRDGVDRAQVSSLGWTDAGLPPSATYTYGVLAVDAAGNRSALSSLVTAKTYCSAQIVSASWDTKRKRVTVRATNSEQPQSTMVLRGDNGGLLGSMAWNSRIGAYELTASGTPTVVTVVASCGGSASRSR